jgi:hypothetical protein
VTSVMEPSVAREALEDITEHIEIAYDYDLDDGTRCPRVALLEVLDDDAESWLCAVVLPDDGPIMWTVVLRDLIDAAARDPRMHQWACDLGWVDPDDR